ATAVSGDGKVVVGYVEPVSTSNGVLFTASRWTQKTGMVDLGALGSASGVTVSLATAVSYDGSVVVGLSTSNRYPIGNEVIASSSGFRGSEAFRWTNATGMQSIAGLLEDNGINLSGWQLQSASGVSADGTVIVGNGIDPMGNPSAWWA